MSVPPMMHHHGASVADGFDDEAAVESDYEKTLYAQSADSSNLALVPGFETKACYVCRNGSIYVDVKSPMFRQATDFLIAITEPQSRPEFIHHYKLTAYSLYAGASINLDTEKILSTLRKISKNELPGSVVSFIEFFTKHYGKVKLVLKRNRIFIESRDQVVLNELLRNETIRQARVSSIRQETIKAESESSKRVTLDVSLEDRFRDDEEANDDVTWVEIDPRRVGDVKRAASKLNFPMLEEYDYMKDDMSPDLVMSLQGHVKTRPYQDKALSKMFGSSRARSGVIVLPCGAGKTLTGISAACTIHKSTLVLCNNTEACKQWISQFLFFTTLARDRIIEFTAGKEVVFPEDGSAVVLATTYSMLVRKDQDRAATSKKSIDQLRSREWGLVILDEVHVAPADNFRKALFTIKAHCKLGLTATLVREDGQIGDLNFLLGPKLYEADWMDLTQAGYLARVQCAEVWCPMSSVFMNRFLREESQNMKKLLYVMNPNKFHACQFLIEKHEARGDKILIFSDSIASVELYAKSLKRYMMYGETTTEERQDLLRKFKLPPGSHGAIQTLVMSSVGDVAIDLPEASVIIQISSPTSSRRQEAQRLGRILRPKTRVGAGPDAYFYSLLSMDTKEMQNNSKRRQYLIDQGYTYRVILWEMLFKEKYHRDVYSSADQEKLLEDLTVEKANKVDTTASQDA